ncbi:MAG TPA: tryptophan-rich sensory protein [Pirellulaceae bacterium]|nr:tryptophan-rich sensory protein [Pirellulaceae bacterium]HMO92744.1 tryptophan-rich sensory protein [Pirellulaceae bacterium]HMP70296.1 tryptophan-rich sensory protein [Pirellulaceae bacterium]
MDNHDWFSWYESLIKPSWTPSPTVISIIWQILYPIIFVCLIFVIVQAARGRISWWITLPFIVNFVANLLFTPIQFGLRNLWLASVDIAIVWLTIIWMAVAIWPHYRLVAVMQLPYFAWVSLATFLQFSITWQNQGR